jgi:regulator of sirC expression with transglutaminase-like and TPR domain
MKRDHTEIHALITLLEDPDRNVSEPVIERLIALGEDAVPPLEQHWEHSIDHPVQQRIENVIIQIQRNTIREELHRWISSRGDNLLYGAYLMARVQYPELEFTSLSDKIEALRSQVWLELNDHLTAMERIKVINYFLFRIQKYNRSTKDIQTPQLYFLNHVLDTHKGSPEILGIIYAEIASRLDLPVYGVDLPLNFLVCYHDPGYLDDPNGILFYINPFSSGTILSRSEIEYFLDSQKITRQEQYLQPCSNIAVIRRLADHLSSAYDVSGYEEKAVFVRELVSMLKEAE